MRYLIDEGMIPNKGSVAGKAAIFQDRLSPILTSPVKTFNWKLGDTQTKAFAGLVDNKMVVAFVAKEGDYQGKVLSAFVSNPENMINWSL
jgi:hypothetical protein